MTVVRSDWAVSPLESIVLKIAAMAFEKSRQESVTSVGPAMATLYYPGTDHVKYRRRDLPRRRR